MMNHQARTLARATGLTALLWAGLCAAQLNELENPGRVSAVQERLYRMHHELDLGVGVLPLDAYYKGLTLQLGYSYHFSDSFSWQVGRGAWSYPLNTGLREQLERDFGVQPTVFEQVEWMVGSDLVWSPVYGKLAVLNQRVLHFGGHLSVGGTVMKMNVGFRPAVNLGVGARLYSSKWLSFRFDVTDNVMLGRSGASGLRVLHVPTLQLSTAFNFSAAE